MRLTKFNAETGQYEYIEPAKTQAEFNEQRKAVIQRLGEFEDRGEVVRCKDCKWWEARAYGSTIGRCENPRNGLWDEYSEDTDYCSYGERSTKDAT